MKASLARRATGSVVFVIVVVSGSLLSAQESNSTPPVPSTGQVVMDSPTNVTLVRTVEDFGAITLQNSELKALPPTLGTHIVKEQFTEDILQVQWRNYDAIDLYVVKPKDVAKPPVIIYLYGYPSDAKAFTTQQGFLDRLTSGGFAAVGFAGALTGYRFRMRPFKETFFTQLNESLATTTHDVQMVLNYLESRGDLDMSRVGILGTGSGATVAILAAAADPRIKAIQCFEPWGDWPKWLATTINIEPQERKDYLKPEFFAKMAPLDPVKWLPNLTAQKVQVQFIDEDDALAKDARAGIEVAAPKNVEVLHFRDRAQHVGAVSNGKFFEWIKDQLRPSTPAQSPVAATAQTKQDTPHTPNP